MLNHSTLLRNKRKQGCSCIVIVMQLEQSVTKSPLSAETRDATVLADGKEVASAYLNDGTIWSLRTNKNYRNMGLATRIVEMLVEEAREMGLDQVKAFVHPKNAPSQRVFEKSGFHVTEETRCWGEALEYAHVLKL